MSEINPNALIGVKITEIETLVGYLKVLEYQLPDCSLLHIVSYHYNMLLDKGTNFPIIHKKIFYRQRDKALEYAKHISEDLLNQY